MPDWENSQEKKNLERNIDLACKLYNKTLSAEERADILEKHRIKYEKQQNFDRENFQKKRMKAVYNILPETEDTLKIMGEQIKLARLRRDLSATLVAERAGISRASLWKVENGNPAVAIGIYAAVLHALGNMDKDLLLVAKDDERGRQMQDLGLLTKKRASRRRK